MSMKLWKIAAAAYVGASAYVVHCRRQAMPPGLPAPSWFDSLVDQVLSPATLPGHLIAALQNKPEPMPAATGAIDTRTVIDVEAVPVS
jgi:hypothetical protein